MGDPEIEPELMVEAGQNAMRAMDHFSMPLMEALDVIQRGTALAVHAMLDKGATPQEIASTLGGVINGTLIELIAPRI